MLDKSVLEIEKKWAQQVVTNAKSILLRNKKIATGKLYNSIRYNVSKDGDISFEYAPEGKWVTQGRRKNNRFPPPAPISRWIKAKGIRGRDPKTGEFIKDKALVFLLQRAIARDGIKPLPFMQMAIDKSMKQLMADLEKSLAAYYGGIIGQA
jgi:hypothetical protein